MTVQVVRSYQDPAHLYTVRVLQGVQSFTLDYHASKKECQWYAKMFRQALRAHDQSRRRQ